MMSSIVNRMSGNAARYSVTLFFSLSGVRPTSGVEESPVRVASSDEFVCHPQIALVPEFIKETTDSSFVLF
jgi:hypothetical protein